MPGNLRLGLTKNLHKVANANLLVSHEIEEPEPRRVSEGLKEALHVERFLLSCHDRSYIRFDEYVEDDYICPDAYKEQPMTEQLLESVRAKYGAVAESSLSNEQRV